MNMVVFVFCIFLTIKCVHNAAIIPASQDINDPVKQFEETFLDPRNARKVNTINGIDLEAFTKNAAIRTNKENALLQQLAFKRNQLFSRETSGNSTGNLLSEIANNDLLNAMILPSAAGHSTNMLGFHPTFNPGTMEKDRIIMELIEQNRRQQLEIQRLVQQNMIRHGRPLLPFMEENLEQLNNQRFGTDILTPTAGRIPQNPATPRPMFQTNEAMPIMNQIRSVISRNNNNMLEKMASQRQQNAMDLEFLKRQTNPFEAPQRSPFFEEITDAFGRRLPLKLKDNQAIDTLMEIDISTPSPLERQNRFIANGIPTITTTENPAFMKTDTTETIIEVNDNTDFNNYTT